VPESLKPKPRPPTSKSASEEKSPPSPPSRSSPPQPGTPSKKAIKKKNKQKAAKERWKKAAEEAEKKGKEEKKKQVEEWRDYLKAKYYKQGKQASEAQNGTILHAYYNHLVTYPDWKRSDIIRAVQLSIPVSTHIINKLIDWWEETHAVPVPNTSNRGKGSKKWQEKKYDREAVKVNLFMVSSMSKWIDKNRSVGRVTTLRHLAGYLQETFGVRISRSQLGRVLVQNGFKWGRVKGVTMKSIKDPERRRVINEFIWKMNEALEEQERGECVLVFLDESYIDTTHHKNFSWHALVDKAALKTDDLTSPDTIKVSSGGRLILLHAMTKDGLLSTKNAEGQYIDVPYMHQGKIASAMQIWKAGSSKGDLRTESSTPFASCTKARSWCWFWITPATTSRWPMIRFAQVARRTT